jgi:hypothetical protein
MPSDTLDAELLCCWLQVESEICLSSVSSDGGKGTGPHPCRAVDDGCRVWQRACLPECRVEACELRPYCLPDITYGRILLRIEGLDLEFTFPVRIVRVIPELPSKALRAGNLTDTTMLIPFTLDPHRFTLHGADEVNLSTMVLCGVCGFSCVA